MMTEVDKKQVYIYNLGDWIVHRNYGIGQIKGIETQSIGEQKTTYYKIEAHNDSTIWVPVASEEELLRPVASKDEFAEVVQVMKRPSRRMNAHFPARIASIRQVSREGNPVMLARMVRDLWARRSRRGQLSTTIVFSQLFSAALGLCATLFSRRICEPMLISEMTNLNLKWRQSHLMIDGELCKKLYYL